MYKLLMTIEAIVAVGLVYVLIPLGIDAYRRLRGAKIVSCPEANAPAEIELDAIRGAASTLSGHRDLQVVSCSRWRDRLDCGQDCVRQIA